MSRHIPERPFPGLLTPETLAAGQEFTDRDPQWPASREQTGIAMEGVLQAALPNIPPGELPVDVDVRSVFDVRPVNSYDVNMVGSVEVAEDNVGAVDFTVPTGYVLVVRRILFSFDEPIPPFAQKSDVLLTLKVNNGVVQYNSGIPVGLDSDSDPVRTFFIADENDLVTVAFAFSENIGTTVWVQLYGNLVRKTGRPAPHEIANPINIRKRG
jgi:hypothetical protein